MTTYRSRALLEDTRQQLAKHNRKHREWDALGVPVVRTKLIVGDYTTVGSSTFVDTKKDIYEIYANMTSEHERFKRECILAHNIGAELVVLVENEDGVTDLDTLSRWTEEPWHFEMRKRKAKAKCVFMTGKRLAKSMATMQERYGVRFEFCTPSEAAERVLRLLSMEGGDLHGNDA